MSSHDEVSARLEPGYLSPQVPDSMAELRESVRLAFEAAKQRGVADWRRMTIAVLKNRLLDLTNRTFSERDYGVRNMRDLVALIPDFISVDDSKTPPIVELINGDAPPVVVDLQHNARVRPDLWDAVMDYSSGRMWVWADGRAVAINATEDDSKYPRLPTLAPDDMKAWRSEFAESHRSGLSLPDAARLDEWQSGRGRTVDLPPILREAWNVQLRLGVAERLRAWFLENEESLPADLLVPAAEPRRVKVQTSEVASLRAFVASCVSVMTLDELRSIQLPAAVLHRHMNLRGDRS